MRPLVATECTSGSGMCSFACQLNLQVAFVPLVVKEAINLARRISSRYPQANALDFKHNHSTHPLRQHHAST
jgi:hypothetical protein